MEDNIVKNIIVFRVTTTQQARIPNQRIFPRYFRFEIYFKSIFFPPSKRSRNKIIKDNAIPLSDVKLFLVVPFSSSRKASPQQSFRRSSN